MIRAVGRRIWCCRTACSAAAPSCLDGDRIVEIVAGPARRRAGEAVHFSFPDHYIVPGFIDVHVHGVEGTDALDGGTAIADDGGAAPRVTASRRSARRRSPAIPPSLRAHARRRPRRAHDASARRRARAAGAPREQLHQPGVQGRAAARRACGCRRRRIALEAPQARRRTRQTGTGLATTSCRRSRRRARMSASSRSRPRSTAASSLIRDARRRTGTTSRSVTPAPPTSRRMEGIRAGARAGDASSSTP